jgi:hypothetical protein
MKFASLFFVILVFFSCKKDFKPKQIELDKSNFDNKYSESEVLTENDISAQNDIVEKDGYVIDSSQYYEVITGKIIIPEGRTSIGYREYMYGRDGGINEKIIEVVIPDGVVVIEELGFGYNGITQLILPFSVKTIEYGAFEENPIQQITIGEDVSIHESRALGSGFHPPLGKYGESFFWDYLKNDKQAGVYTYNHEISAWYYNGEPITIHYKNIIISDGIQEISGPEYQYKNILTVIFSTSLEKIGVNAFRGNFIQKIEIPHNVKEIALGAFDLNEIVEIKIGNDVIIAKDDDGYQTLGRYSWKFIEKYDSNGKLSGTYIYDMEVENWIHIE